MNCDKCGKEIHTATMFKVSGSDKIWKVNVAIGYECGCYEKWLTYVKKRDPTSKIKRNSWGARIYFSKGEDQAKEIARDFVKREVFIFR